ncbi:MAG: right-handed parallel beta-helix repeat-containing protein [Desulfomicrobium sp.]|nr:right-handed parallel beta-helix repeat-containing protein [Desulfomicrobium sp.]
MKFLRLALLFGLVLFFSSPVLAEKQFFVEVVTDNSSLFNMPFTNAAQIVDQAQKGWMLHSSDKLALQDGTTFYEVYEIDHDGTGFWYVHKAYPNLPTSSVFINAQDVKIVPDPNADASVTTITVSTELEFLAALGSNRVIILAPGQYNLSASAPEQSLEAIVGKDYYNDDEDMAGLYKSLQDKGITWKYVGDGYELCLTGITNLTIQGPPDGPATLLVDPRYAFVLKFDDCHLITLKNFIAGHSEGGYCDGGVLGFANSSSIDISGCRLFGSGTVGLGLYDVSNINVASTTIFDCTYGIMQIWDSESITFKSCLFHNNKEYYGVEIRNAQNIIFDSCSFMNNQGPMFSDGSEYFGASQNSIIVKNSIFNSNTDTNIQNSPHVTFENCTFK